MIRKNDRARRSSAVAIECDVATQSTIAGARTPPALPNLKAAPTAAPRICVGNNSGALSAKLLTHEDALVAGLGPASRLFITD